MRTWTNWAGTVSAAPERVHQPRTVHEIADVITHAAAGERRVRAWGSGHSFTPIGVATSDAIDLSCWSGIVSADMDTGLVTVRSGTTLRRLNADLDALGLALSNLGDIDVQTIAGAVSTGTHGTGATFGGLATQIVALELVLATGAVLTCSAEQRPELFAAAKISLGALGVLSTVTLRCEPAFLLAADERPEPIEQVLAGFDESAKTHDHFEFYWFPYGRNALVKRNNRLPATAKPRPLSPSREFVEYRLTENVAFGAVCRLGRAVPRLVPRLSAMSSVALSARGYAERSHRVFVTHRGVKFVESEFAIPRESVHPVLAELRALIPTLETPVAFPVEVRVAAADDIWLSTAYGRDTAYVAIHQFVGMAYQQYFAAFSTIAGAVGGRPHWGKLHALDAVTLRERYPRFEDFVRMRNEMDPAGIFRNAYLDRVLGPPPA